LLNNEIKALQEEQKLMKELVGNLKKALKTATDEEEKLLKTLGKKSNEVMRSIESILSKNHIERPYYHGGKYNGKAMVRLMDYSQSSKIMDEIATYLLSVPNLDVSQREEVNEWIPKFNKILSVYDGIFSIARMPSGTVDDNYTAKLEGFIATSMKLWRGLGSSITGSIHAGNINGFYQAYNAMQRKSRNNQKDARLCASKPVLQLKTSFLKLSNEKI